MALQIQPLPLAGLPLSRFTRRGRKDYSTAYVSIKGSLLLLCVAEQYRGAVELSETEGLRKSIWVIITFTMMFRNQFVPQAIPLFVEPQALWLVARTDKETQSLRSFLTPSPYGTSPISLRSQGQKRLLHCIFIASNEARATSVVALRTIAMPLAQCGYGNSK